MRTRIFVWLALALIIAPAACSQGTPQNSGAAMKFDSNAASGTTSRTTLDPKASDYLIGAEDVLSINVWKEPEISRSLPVRSDGKITLPLAGEIEVAGHTTGYVQDEIKTRLKKYMSAPEVTVMVSEMKSRSFTVLGEVLRAGKHPLNRPTTVLDAIALAGGFREFAKRKSIYVLRDESGTQKRLSFNYNDVIKNRNTAQNITLQPGDVVVVP